MWLRKNFIHFLISILLLSSLIFIIKTINFKNNKDSNKIRDLLLDNAKTYLCNIAGSRLTAKYEGGFDEERGDAEENLNKDQQSIIDSIRDFNYRNIKPYLKKVIIFIIISVFILIFIFIWIICGFCSVLNCGLFFRHLLKFLLTPLYARALQRFLEVPPSVPDAALYRHIPGGRYQSARVCCL